jgi:hypothetical protein
VQVIQDDHHRDRGGDRLEPAANRVEQQEPVPGRGAAWPGVAEDGSDRSQQRRVVIGKTAGLLEADLASELLQGT